MEVFEAIRGRRSVRKYTSQPVLPEMIDRIIEAGTWAPSAKNVQPWRFLVIDGHSKDQVAEIVRRIGEQMAQGANSLERELGIGTIKTAGIIRQAPILITVWNAAHATRGEAAVLQDPNPNRLLSWSVRLQSVSAAIQNMLLSAHALGLGGLWICDINHAVIQVKEYLAVEDDLVAGVVIGYSEDSPRIPQRRPWAETVRWFGVSSE